jgi:hypothetical protein
MRKKIQKPYWEMTTAELREATKEFDREDLKPSAVPVPPEEYARLKRAMKRGRGRPKVGEGTKSVLVTIEQGLLRKADALAERERSSRSQLIAEGLRRVLADRVPKRRSA